MLKPDLSPSPHDELRNRALGFVTAPNPGDRMQLPNWGFRHRRPGLFDRPIGNRGLLGQRCFCRVRFLMVCHGGRYLV